MKEALKATRGTFLKQERFICISARCLLPVRDCKSVSAPQRLQSCLRQGQPAKQTTSHTHTHTPNYCLSQAHKRAYMHTCEHIPDTYVTPHTYRLWLFFPSLSLYFCHHWFSNKLLLTVG